MSFFIEIQAVISQIQCQKFKIFWRPVFGPGLFFPTLYFDDKLLLKMQQRVWALVAVIAVFFLAWALWLTPHFNNFSSVAMSPQAHCKPKFPYLDRWRGGDAAYSVPIDDHRSLWFFGDTFVQKTSDIEHREGSDFAHNTVAVSECLPDGEFTIKYYWKDFDGVGKSFLSTPDESKEYYWIFSPFMMEGKLYVFLLKTQHGPPAGPLDMPFRFAGVDLGIVDNPTDDPNEWKYMIYPLTQNRSFFPGSAVIRNDGYVYVFIFRNEEFEKLPRYLIRVPEYEFRRPDTLKSKIETYVGGVDHPWAKGFQPDRAKIVMADNSSEMSVHYDQNIRRWIALYLYPNMDAPDLSKGISNTIRIASADSLVGPWESYDLYKVPEFEVAKEKERLKSTFCYAAKFHPQYFDEDNMFFTYVCNLYTPHGTDWKDTFRVLWHQPNWYLPVPVTMSRQEIYEKLGFMESTQ